MHGPMSVKLPILAFTSQNSNILYWRKLHVGTKGIHYCVSIETLVTRTRHNDKLYVHCLYC